MPSGRYCYRRDIGTASAPELFQHAITRVLEGTQGVVNGIDDILLYTESRHEHNQGLIGVLKDLKRPRGKLEDKNCELCIPSVTVFEVVVDSNWVYPDPGEFKALQDFPAPTEVTGKRHLMDTINHCQMFHFTPVRI